MTNEYSIIAYGRVKDPRDWFYNPSYLVNRIYDISGGTAYYMNQYQLRPGFLYIFRANPDFQVSQSETDPVDHIFFDFLTYKRLLDQDFIEIDLSEQPKLLHLIKAMEEDFLCSPPLRIAYSYLELLIHYLTDQLITDRTYSELTSAALDLIHNSPIAAVLRLLNYWDFHPSPLFPIFSKKI